jgi:hypothetical protein
VRVRLVGREHVRECLIAEHCYARARSAASSS